MVDDDHTPSPLLPQPQDAFHELARRMLTDTSAEAAMAAVAHAG